MKTLGNNSRRKTNLGFTLIELLAVIIILGVLMIIAIPSVTEYISSSRKSSYITIATRYIDSVRNKVNGGSFAIYDKEITYYIPGSCVSLERGGESPYGDFEDLYVVVTYNGSGYDYYFTSRDETNMGIYLTYQDLLNVDVIQSGVTSIRTDIGVGNREKILLLNDTCDVNTATEIVATSRIDEKGKSDGTDSEGSSTVIDNQLLTSAVEIGDYIAYDAGSWNETVGNQSMQLGGYTQGASRNNGITCSDNGTIKNGWRVIDKSSGNITLVSAGITECYTNVWGRVNDSINYLKSHDYGNYVNSNYATSANILTKELLESSSGIDVKSNTDLTNDVYLAGSNYWIPYIDDSNSNNMLRVQPSGYVGGMGGYEYGIRVVVNLKNNLYIGSGSGTATDPYVMTTNSTSTTQTETKINKNGIITGYWQNWKSSNATKLRNVSVNYDIVALSFGVHNPSDAKGIITFSLDQYLASALNYSEANLISDIKYLKSRGQKVILSVGGANSEVIIDDNESVNNFINSVYSIIQQYDLDGIDVNIENTVYPTYLVTALNGLKAKCGSKFTLTFAPQTVDFKVDRNGNVSGTYYEVLSQVKDITTIVNMQLYNSGTQYGSDGAVYTPGTVDFITAITDVMIINGIPANKVGIGINCLSTKTGYVEPEVVVKALNSLKKGGTTIDGSYVINSSYNNIGGVMIYSLNQDMELNNKFITTIAKGMEK